MPAGPTIPAAQVPAAPTAPKSGDDVLRGCTGNDDKDRVALLPAGRLFCGDLFRKTGGDGESVNGGWGARAAAAADGLWPPAVTAGATPALVADKAQCLSRREDSTPSLCEAAEEEEEEEEEDCGVSMRR